MGREGEDGEGLLLLKSFEEALAADISAVPASVRAVGLLFVGQACERVGQSWYEATAQWSVLLFYYRCRCSYPMYMIILSGLRVIILMTFHVE